MNVLVVEDGWEYTDTLGRFLTTGFTWTRAGCGAEGLAAVASGRFDAVFLDMRFDRIPEEALLGDREVAAGRFAGDVGRALRFLQDNQGRFILSALRRAGHRIPVLLSYPFDEEPRRWARLSARLGPVDYVPDAAGPSVVGEKLRALVGRPVTFRRP